jgi:two-component system CheB/CheR fusion protein
VREKVLFVLHNILRDPFRVWISSRVVILLIYLNRETQERLMELFSFSLRRGDFFWLSEFEIPMLFSPVDKKHRIYKSLGAISQPPLPLTYARWEVKAEGDKLSKPEPPSFGAIHHKIVEEYVPPSVLINEEYEIVHSSENARRFLRFSSGEPSRNLLKVVHPALQLDLRAALAMAKQENRQTEARHVSVKLDDEERTVDLIVRCKWFPELGRTFFLIVFDDGDSVSKKTTSVPASEMIVGDEAMKLVVGRLEDELQQTRDRLRATIEQSETATEELKASNEELQAINEELRSATEELETSKEELQSLNEELTTVNQELKEKVDEVSRVNSDLQNLMRSTDIGTIFLDSKLRIKRYTPRVEDLFNIISSDIGRPLEHVTRRFDYADLPKDAAEVLQTPAAGSGSERRRQSR